MCSNLRVFSFYLNVFYLFALDFVLENIDFYSTGRLGLNFLHFSSMRTFKITKPSSPRNFPGQGLFPRANRGLGSVEWPGSADKSLPPGPTWLSDERGVTFPFKCKCVPCNVETHGNPLGADRDPDGSGRPLFALAAPGPAPVNSSLAAKGRGFQSMRRNTSRFQAASSHENACEALTLHPCRAGGTSYGTDRRPTAP